MDIDLVSVALGFVYDYSVPLAGACGLTAKTAACAGWRVAKAVGRGCKRLVSSPPLSEEARLIMADLDDPAAEVTKRGGLSYLTARGRTTVPLYQGSAWVGVRHGHDEIDMYAHLTAREYRAITAKARAVADRLKAIDAELERALAREALGGK
jgi:hypothetical protein